MGKRKIKSMKRMVERKNGKTAVEIIEYFKSGESHPNEIFQIYEELSKFSEKEIEEAIKETRIGDAIGMSYITAIEMKKNGRWVLARVWWKLLMEASLKGILGCFFVLLFLSKNDGNKWIWRSSKKCLKNY